MTKIAYAELRCKTNYSFLVGASRPQELVERAAQIGLSALAITDHHGVYGVPKAYRACREFPALKLIVGAELCVRREGARIFLPLLAQDRAAYGLMCRMISASHAGRQKGEAELVWNDWVEMMSLPGAGGLIALPGTELAGEYGFFKESFGERALLPLSRFLDGQDAHRTRELLEAGVRYGLRVVATNDVHYHVRERRRLHDVVSAIREGTTLDQVGKRVFSNSERFLKSPRQMHALFKDMPDALEQTLEVAERCTFSMSELKYRYPTEWIPEGHTAQSYLVELVWKGAKTRYPDGVPGPVVDQITHELGLIEELLFGDYFLTIWEIVEFARNRKILCQGRGSAANSVVCYCLGITAVDPVRMNLLFERFISVERGEPPDIDVDFEHERREEVIQHIYQKYGRDRAAMVAAVITYQNKLALREVTKVFQTEKKLPHADASIEKLAAEIHGFPRHLSIHSGGFTLSSDPLIETVPVEPARMEGRTIVQWDKDDLDAIGLLKVDVLSLGMLTAIRKTLDLVGLELHTIPAEDPETYAMIQRADTVGVFQIESRAQMSMLPRLLPKNYYDLVVEIALVRPGPIVGKMVHPYLRRRRGQEPVDMPHPKLIPILAKTLGVPLFQEQVMKMAIVLADFTPGEADRLRRAIGAWRSSGEIETMGKKLMAGFLANGLPQEFVDRIFLQIQGFAHYGFPESHAASFALLVYASSYLKCHHPAEFACALINSQPMGFYSNHTLVDDAKRHGVVALPVDPNRSIWDCELENGQLRMGFRVVSGMMRAQAEELIEERKKRPFRDMTDFLSRTQLKKDVLRRLAMGEAFSVFGLDQRHALWQILAYQVLCPVEPSGQLNLFSGHAMAAETSLFDSMDLYTAIRSDYESYQLSVRGHPMAAIRDQMSRVSAAFPAPSNDIKRMAAGRRVRAAGLLIVRQRPPTANGVVFATLEDEQGFLDLILHREIHAKFEEILSAHSFLVVQGQLQRDGLAISILVQEVHPISEGLLEVSSRDFR